MGNFLKYKCDVYSRIAKGMFGIEKYKICFLKIDYYFNNTIVKGLISISL